LIIKLYNISPKIRLTKKPENNIGKNGTGILPFLNFKSKIILKIPPKNILIIKENIKYVKLKYKPKTNAHLTSPKPIPFPKVKIKIVKKIRV
jgi:hypothetical protein